MYNNPQTSPVSPAPAAPAPTSPELPPPPRPPAAGPATTTTEPQSPPTPHPWERQPGETQEAYSLFTAYLNLGPCATVPKTLAAVRQLPGEAGRTRESLYHFCTRFNWRERAVAKRQYDANLQFKSQENLLLETSTLWSHRANTQREQQWENSQSLNELGQEALQKVRDGEGAPPGMAELPRYFNGVSRLGRQALEPPPATLVTAHEDPAVAHERELALNKGYGPIAAAGTIPSIKAEIDRERAGAQPAQPAGPSSTPPTAPESPKP